LNLCRRFFFFLSRNKEDLGGSFEIQQSNEGLVDSVGAEDGSGNGSDEGLDCNF